MIRTAHEGIPEDAEIVLAVRWRQEVEVQATAPTRRAPPTPILPAGVEPDAGYLEEETGGDSCATCGGVPDIQGPTPGCHDVNGCARVRQTKGEIAVARSVEPDGAPNVGIGGRGPGTQMLVNRDTGEKVFADKTGRPYGKHDDYQK